MVPKISIIVPVYNVEKYMKKCIDSILTQDLQEFELILINDGSTDDSGNICDYYSKQDERVKVIHQPNRGQAAARNEGLRIAVGDYIGFVDGDDWIEANMYKNLYDSCMAYGTDASIIGLREVSEGGEHISHYIPSDVISLSEILRKAYPCNKLFRREIIIDNNLFFNEEIYYEDVELIPKLILKCNKVTTIKDIGYNYLKRSGSTTSSRDEKILDNLKAYVKLKEYLEEEHIYDKHEKEFIKAVLHFKRYYTRILYDYPTKFLINHYKQIKKDFESLGGLSQKEIFSFLIRHVKFSVWRIGSTCKRGLKIS